MRKDIVKLISKKEWYHQRFDGSPLYLFFVGEAEVRKEARKPKGTEATWRVSFFQDRKADWYLDMADIRRGSEVMLSLAKQDSEISTKLLKAWRNDEEEFQNFFDSFNEKSLSVMSDKDLLTLYHHYANLAVNRFTSSAIIDHFALGTDEHIAKMIREEVGRLGKESEFTEIFSVATAPVHQSFINQAEMEMLAIAIEAPKDKARVAAYQRKYFWVKNNYIDVHVLLGEDFKEEIEAWLSSGADLKAKYQRLQETPVKNARATVALFEKYNFSPLLRTLLKISEEFTWWQDERKKATYLNIHLGTQILGEMARRKQIDPELTKYLVPQEVDSWFNVNEPATPLLEERKRLCGSVCWERGYYVAVGDEVDEMRRIMFPVATQDKVKDIRGLSASVGRVIGRVKVVGSVQEIGKVEAGDILVAVMTRPDYISGLRKAAAIVTNEGGITCHAAIVSRELGIPCVIGTKIATAVLRDGDLVEVNANHGVVTILK